jgi:hypothetical protein
LFSSHTQWLEQTVALKSTLATLIYQRTKTGQGQTAFPVRQRDGNLRAKAFQATTPRSSSIVYFRSLCVSECWHFSQRLAANYEVDILM